MLLAVVFVLTSVDWVCYFVRLIALSLSDVADPGDRQRRRLRTVSPCLSPRRLYAERRRPQRRLLHQRTVGARARESGPLRVHERACGARMGCPDRQLFAVYPVCLAIRSTIRSTSLRVHRSIHLMLLIPTAHFPVISNPAKHNTTILPCPRMLIQASLPPHFAKGVLMSSLRQPTPMPTLTCLACQTIANYPMAIHRVQ